MDGRHTQLKCTNPLKHYNGKHNAWEWYYSTGVNTVYWLGVRAGYRASQQDSQQQK